MCDWMSARYLLLWCLLLSACGRERWVEVEGRAMGMAWRIQAAGLPKETLNQEAETCFAKWDKATSLWRADSELVRFNQAPAGRWIEASAELWQAVTLAREVAEETEFGLDITVGPLVALWGFGAGARAGSIPAGEEIQRTREASQWRHLELDVGRRSIRKRAAGLRLDVNCVVEGLALDELAARLRALGCADFLLELGGELLAAGRSRRGGPWLAGVQSPDGGARDVMAPIALHNEALATSGTYRHRREEGGHILTHVIDPRTGWPVRHRLVSVSVVHESAARADAYATALLVLGPKWGREVAERLGLRVFWVEAAE